MGGFFNGREVLNMSKENDIDRPFVTENSDPATAFNKMDFTEEPGKTVSVGGGATIPVVNRAIEAETPVYDDFMGYYDPKFYLPAGLQR